MLKAAAVFSNNMVLQRRKNVRIFGTCSDDCKRIIVNIPELRKDSEAVIENGKWEAVFSPMEACGRCTVIIDSGKEKIVFENAAVGEVWLAGGQSNMEFELRNDKNGRKALSRCSEENVRFYYTPKCEMYGEKLIAAEENSAWQLPDEKSAECWSAVGYYFAKELSRRLGVTVGVIGCNWGGTSASAWMSREYLSQDERIRPYIDNYDKAINGRTVAEMITEYDEYTAYHADWEKKMQKCYEENPHIKWEEVLKICGENRYPGPMGCKNPMRPCGLYETMISRVAPYTLAGVIYYQGESDDHRPDTYYTLLKALIENWRKVWLDDQLPFMLVQLPMFKYADDPDHGHWAKIREAQMKVFRTVKNTGIASVLDCGEFNNIHPTNKLPVGFRLYLQAMYHVYGDCDPMKAFPPMYDRFETAGENMLIHFRFCNGFELKGALDGFELAGADKIFHKASAEITGNSIALHSEEVKTPHYARFKWVNYAEVTLFGKNGLPVPPFSTMYI